MAILENDLLKIEIREKGAELTSVFHKVDQIEYLWQGDEKVWGWHAPNLFPVVGGCLNDELLIDGKFYQMKRHGFARHSEFKLIENTGSHAKFSFFFNDETLAVYPYCFEFQVLYDLFDDELRVSYKVINMDDHTVYFSVGGHPAFNLPFYPGEKPDDYYLEFEHSEIFDAHSLSENGLFSGDVNRLGEGNVLEIREGLFDNDALVFKKLDSSYVYLKSKNHGKKICVKFPHFNYLGIWAKPGAPFLCIEPWLGCADSEGEVKAIQDKEAIQKVEHGHVFEATYSLGFHAEIN